MTQETQAPVVAARDKAQKARALFKLHVLDAITAGQTPKTRKEMILMFTADEIGLTEKGAATYYQNFRREANLEQPRTATTLVASVTATPNAEDQVQVDQAVASTEDAKAALAHAAADVAPVVEEVNPETPVAETKADKKKKHTANA